MTTVSPSLTSVPIEVTRMIFGYIPDEHKGPFSATCRAYSNIADGYWEQRCRDAASALVDALARKCMTPEEDTAVKDAEANFYEAFTGRCAKLCSGSENHIDQYTVVIQELGDMKLACNTERLSDLTGELNKTILYFSRKVCTDIANDFAKQPAESITIESFVAKTHAIGRFFAPVPCPSFYEEKGIDEAAHRMLEAETILRNVLHAKYQEAFAQLAKEYLGTSSTNPKIAAIRLADQGSAERIGYFYEELGKLVVGVNKQQRYTRIHEIMGIVFTPIRNSKPSKVP